MNKSLKFTYQYSLINTYKIFQQLTNVENSLTKIMPGTVKHQRPLLNYHIKWANHNHNNITHSPFYLALVYVIKNTSS
jgi:hypothetical protein